MRSTELHGERRGWNLHFKRRVVRCGVIFLEVWIFRDVRDQFQNFVAHHFSAAAAKRENGVAHQDHAGARLVLMAYLVDPRLLDQLSGSQRAIALIKSFNVSLVQFHDAFSCVLLSPEARWLMGATRPIHGMHSGQQQVGAFWFRKKVLPILFQATQAAGCTAALQGPRAARPGGEF
jgi:hypothetical protein